MASMRMSISKAAQFHQLQSACANAELSAEAIALLEAQRLGSTSSTSLTTTLQRFPKMAKLREILLPHGDEDYEANRGKQREFLPMLVANGKANAQQKAFWRVCEQRKMFELYTQDLIDRMLEYLEMRAMQLCRSGKVQHHAPICVLEIGAGSGLFTRALRQNQRVSSLLTFKASDINPPSETPRESMVERMDARRSLRRHSPTFVLCLWMPSGIDFTSLIRECGACQEYILIGIPDSSVCGDEWATWGVASAELIENYGLLEGAKPPHEEDGWHRQPLPVISENTLCRFDATNDSKSFSCAVSFRRELEETSTLLGHDILKPPRPYHMMTLSELVVHAESIPRLHQ